jgi:enamine deaminase RidA (YjgF/YER057c/UK114 family)
MRALQPPGWAKPKGYANGIEAQGRLVFVAGQIGWKADAVLAGPDLPSQTRQALANIVAVLAEAGAEARHIARMTWYVTDKSEYNRDIKAIGAIYRDIIGSHYPTMTLVQVADLLEPGAKVEIEATAVVP